MAQATVLGAPNKVAFLQLLHCSSSEVAAEVMLTLHDKTGVDDHAASSFLASCFAALLPDDDDAASISPRVIHFMTMLPEVLGRLARQEKGQSPVFVSRGTGVQLVGTLWVDF